MVNQNPVPKRPAKRAVVIIHGIGNQTPLATLRGFVDSVWTSDDELTVDGSKRESWPAPETLEDSFELRRITTTLDKKDTRTDFFEFYWAHMMEDTQFSTVLWWFRRIFWRSPSRVPCNLTAPWFGGIAALIVVIGIAASVAFLALISLQTLPESLCWAAL